MNTLDRASAIEKRDAAYEIKFLVPVTVAEAAVAWARAHLEPDPHADGATGDVYRVNSLYFDTPKLDVFEKKGSYGRAKYRVRRYGQAPAVFLERKLKAAGLVSKRRTAILDQELVERTALAPDPEWVGYWFCRRLQARTLSPQCQIRYQRVARVGFCAQGPIRLTMDRDVCAFPTREFGVAETGGWIPVLPDKCILELKFRLAMPPLFKSLMEELLLTPQPVSKYRLSIQAFGLDADLKAGAPVEGNGQITADLLRAEGREEGIAPAMAQSAGVDAAIAPRER